MGVWIETPLRVRYSMPKTGHTLYGCVDWNSHWWYNCQRFQSHPVWVCGLKLKVVAGGGYNWGHTLYGCVDWNWKSRKASRLRTGHTLYGCVDWNRSIAEPLIRGRRHTLYGCVDWNWRSTSVLLPHWCHTLYGCVDWNWFKLWRKLLQQVTPCMGVWIETAR